MKTQIEDGKSTAVKYLQRDVDAGGEHLRRAAADLALVVLVRVDVHADGGAGAASACEIWKSNAGNWRIFFCPYMDCNNREEGSTFVTFDAMPIHVTAPKTTPAKAAQQKLD